MDEIAFLAEYAGLIHFVARKFRPTTALDLDDMVQLGRIGALAAYGNYDPARHNALKSWVYTGIVRSIVDAYRKVHHVHQRTRDRDGEATGYGQGIRFSPIEYASSVRAPGNFPTARMDVARLLGMCEARDRRLLEARYLDERTMPEIAAEFGLTCGWTSRLIRDALARLRALAGTTE
jgi:RNA polymerase sigma factor (sigma-70 family)